LNDNSSRLMDFPGLFIPSSISSGGWPIKLSRRNCAPSKADQSSECLTNGSFEGAFLWENIRSSLSAIFRRFAAWQKFLKHTSLG
jgi:hypothetical protein